MHNTNEPVSLQVNPTKLIVSWGSVVEVVVVYGNEVVETRSFGAVVTVELDGSSIMGGSVTVRKNSMLATVMQVNRDDAHIQALHRNFDLFARRTGVEGSGGGRFRSESTSDRSTSGSPDRLSSLRVIAIAGQCSTST